MIPIPGQIGWKQPNMGDTQGTIWSSHNLDLTSKSGVLRISPRLLLNANTTDLTNLSAVPCAIKFWGPGADIWISAGSRMFTTANAGPDGTLSQDATSSTPTNQNSNQSDIEILPDVGVMLVSGASTTVKYLDSGSAWNSCTSTLIDATGIKMMSYFRAQNRIHIVDDAGKSISTISNAATPVITVASAGVQYTLKALVAGGSVEIISWIKASGTRQWIGTINFTGQPGKVYAWDGSQSSGPNEVYHLESCGSLSCVIKNGVPHIIDVDGKLLALNGGTFLELARLPFENKRTHDISGVATNRMVHYNGMSLVKGRININVNSTLYDYAPDNQPTTTLLEKVPSGVWEYTLETGLYHKASIGLTKSGGTIKDYGQQRISTAGVIVEMDVKNTNFSSNPNGSYMLGCGYFTDVTTITNGVFYDDLNDTLQKYGYLVTPKIFSSDVQDSWQKFYARHKKLLNTTDSIVVKYRTNDLASTEATITWVDTTHFTSSVSGYAVGDEVEIIHGDGAGKCAHITAIVGTTFTLDDTFAGVTTNTARARFQNWKKITSQTDQGYQLSPFPLDSVVSTWIQFKICMQFTGKNEVNDFILLNTEQQ